MGADATCFAAACWPDSIMLGSNSITDPQPITFDGTFSKSFFLLLSDFVAIPYIVLNCPASKQWTAGPQSQLHAVCSHCASGTQPLCTFSGSFVIERILHYITEVELCLIDFNSFAGLLLTGNNC